MFKSRIAPGLELLIGSDRILHSEKSAYQDIVLFENATLGRVLLLDGIVQLSSLDQRTYHLNLVSAAARRASGNERALILGGGDGGAAAICVELGFKHVDVVELDERVVQTCREGFPEIFAELREGDVTHFHIQDARKFLQDVGAGHYDIAVCDFTDFDITNQTQYLYSRPFYLNVARSLNAGGAFSTQAGTAEASPRLVRKIHSSASGVFSGLANQRFSLLSFGACSAIIVSGTVAPNLS